MEKKSVLCVDDEEIFLRSIRRQLSPFHAIEIESCLSKALEMLDKKHYDIIIVDFKMPIMNGIEFLERARILDPNSVKIMLSAYCDELPLDRILDTSLVQFVMKKPASTSELLEIISKN